MAMAYWDIGLVLFAMTLVKPGSHTMAYAHRLRAKHSFGLIYVAVLISASLWPLVIGGWLLGFGRDDQRP